MEIMVAFKGSRGKYYDANVEKNCYLCNESKWKITLKT